MALNPTLTLDPSTSFGWALHIPSDDGDRQKDRLIYGTWNLGKSLRPGVYFYRLWSNITGVRKEYGIEDRQIQIVVEDTSLNAMGNRDTKHLAESWLGQVELYCEVKKFPPPIPVGVNTWRAAFMGRSAAPKEVGAGEKNPGKRSDIRRKWIKAETIKACEARGLKPKDDNQADALGIMFWHLNGGAVVQHQRREEKKARTKAKRNQLKLFGAAA